MKSATEWNWQHTMDCANDPNVHGQMPSNPKMIAFISEVQADALKHAAEICEANKEKWGAAYNDIMSEIRLAKTSNENTSA